MSKNPQKMPNTSSVLEFKSSTFFSPILILHSNDLAAIEQSLQEKISLAPDFFKHSPLIIDVRTLNEFNQDFKVPEIVDMLRKIGLFPIGLRGGNDQQNKQAKKLSIPVDTGQEHENGAAARDKNSSQEEKPVVQGNDDSSAEHNSNNAGCQQESKATAAPDSAEKIEQSVVTTVPARSTLISQPVRSGQRIYAQGDLVVMSQVSAGAEIMAEGDIHVYNTLRGRALAGVQGNINARIFCLDLQAELVSIAGDYKTSEHITTPMQKKPMQVFLQDHALIIKEIA